MTREERDDCMYWVWLAGACGAASKDFAWLMAHYVDPFDIYRLDDEELERLDGIGDRTRLRLANKSLVWAAEVLQSCMESGVQVYHYRDRRYPECLRTLVDPPVVLYVLGELPEEIYYGLCIGMVGTRKMSEYGRQTAYKISHELGAAGCVIVSGMALGVDGVSACGVLAAGGKTVAVLGSGFNHIYPKEHERLKDAILERGALVSEYPPDEYPRQWNFPKRNRLISGLCQGVILIESAAKGGSMITAQMTIDQGKALFALPGKVGERNSEGPNAMIKLGAYVALSSADIKKHYEYLYKDCFDEERMDYARRHPVNIDEALRRYGVSGMYYRGRYDEAAAYVPTVPEAPTSRSPKPSRQSRSAEKPTEKKTTEKKMTEKEMPSLTVAEYLAGVTPVGVEPITVDEAIRMHREEEAERVAEERAVERGRRERKQLREQAVGDPSSALLSTLDPMAVKVFEQMPVDRAVAPDALLVGGADMGTVLMALSMLEIVGLVTALPGGLYIRA